MNPKNSDKLLSLVATLYYVDNQSQKDVAEIAGVSQAGVSRLLAEARNRGIVQITVGDYQPRAQDLEKQLRTQLKLNHVVVVKRIIGRQHALHRRALGYFAAPIIQQMVRPDSVVCIAAGRQIANVVSQMKPHPVPGVSVLQTMGGIGTMVDQHDAIELARKLADLWGGQLHQLHTPAIADDPRSRAVFMSHQQIRTILAMMDQAKLALVGIGGISDSLFVERHVLQPPDIKRLEQKGVVGEICGRFFDAQGNECQTVYRDRVISISLEQLRAAPEVVAVSAGTNRAAGIRAAAQGKLIKSLITDDQTAAAILA